VNITQILRATNVSVISAAIIAASVAANAKAATTEADATKLLAKYNCSACHALDKKLVGPSFKDIAAKYAGDATASARLAKKIKLGGSGAWGTIPMPPNSLSNEDNEALVEWILARK
jgi:cytochrome c